MDNKKKKRKGNSPLSFLPELSECHSYQISFYTLRHLLCTFSFPYLAFKIISRLSRNSLHFIDFSICFPSDTSCFHACQYLGQNVSFTVKIKYRLNQQLSIELRMTCSKHFYFTMQSVQLNKAGGTLICVPKKGISRSRTINTIMFAP